MLSFRANVVICDPSALKAKLDSSRTEVKSLCVAYYDALAKEKADYEKVIMTQPTKSTGRG